MSTTSTSVTNASSTALHGGPSGPVLREFLSASDLTTVTRAMSSAYSEVTVRAPRAKRGLQMKLEVFNLPNLKLGNLTLSSSSVRSPSYPWYAVCLPVSGKIRISSDTASSVIDQRHGVVVSPGTPVEVEYLTAECRMRTILIERSDLEEELAAIMGRTVTTPPRFEFRLDLTQPANALERAVALLTGELVERDGLAAISAMSARLGRLVIAGLLVSQPHNYLAVLTDRTATAGPKAIRTAVAVIEESPRKIQTVADIAKASLLSVRALDEGFRRHVGISPMAYHRQVRLARAHDELVNADPDQTTATIVAHNWAFWHYGRFAAEYRKKYGRTPAATLRQSRVTGR